MRHSLSLLLAVCFLCMPLKTVAQSSLPPQAAAPASQSCQGTKIYVRVKLMNGKKITGDLVEQTPQSATLCADGRLQTFSASEIREISSKMTSAQRARHTLRVLVIEGLAFMAFGLLLYSRANR